MNVIAIIPARYDSTRLAGKVLLKDTGKYLIQHTYERAVKAKLIDKVIIATDSQKVMDACDEFGAVSVMTSKSHQSGTDRIAQAVADIQADIIINLQGDEPEVDPDNIDTLVKLMIDNPDYKMATLISSFKRQEDVENPNIVKCITDVNGRAIYFSRLPIPYSRASKGLGPVESYSRHIGIYAYQKDFLQEFTQLKQASLEKLEKLEQLRAIENGYDIYTATVSHFCDGIDTQNQYDDFVKRTNKEQR